jgi:hypothetical protein
VKIESLVGFTTGIFCFFEESIMEYIPLASAAKRYGVEEAVLTQLILAGMIETRAVSEGILVAVDKNGNFEQSAKQPQTKEEIIAAKFKHLQGKNISSSEASRKYSKKHGVPISQVQFSRWAKYGLITVLEKGYRIQLNESEVAYCAEVFAQKYREYDGQLRGVNIFDEDGDPYQVKYPDVAEGRRNLRRSGMS